jgi:hypothetical protein
MPPQELHSELLRERSLSAGSASIVLQPATDGHLAIDGTATAVSRGEPRHAGASPGGGTIDSSDAKQRHLREPEAVPSRPAGGSQEGCSSFGQDWGGRRSTDAAAGAGIVVPCGSAAPLPSCAEPGACDAVASRPSVCRRCASARCPLSAPCSSIPRGWGWPFPEAIEFPLCSSGEIPLGDGFRDGDRNARTVSVLATLDG